MFVRYFFDIEIDRGSSVAKPGSGTCIQSEAIVSIACATMESDLEGILLVQRNYSKSHDFG